MNKHAEIAAAQAVRDAIDKGQGRAGSLQRLAWVVIFGSCEERVAVLRALQPAPDWTTSREAILSRALELGKVREALRATRRGGLERGPKSDAGRDVAR